MNTLKKTNAMRLLEQSGIFFDYFEYETNDGKIDATSVASKIGQSPEQVFKTLVTQSSSHDYFVFVVPSIGELDLKSAAKAAKQKSIEMIAQKQLLPLTGYVHGGCSPIGMKKPFPTFIDETALYYDKICISGGKVGLNISINPQDLARYLNAEFYPLIKE